ncbi:MAG: hypothetical protein WC634_02705 [archaeon]
MAVDRECIQKVELPLTSFPLSPKSSIQFQQPLIGKGKADFLKAAQLTFLPKNLSKAFFH